MKILVTGFDPFGGETVNPSYEAVKLLPDTIAGAQIIKLQVPTRFALSGTVLEAAVNGHRCGHLCRAGRRAVRHHTGKSCHQPCGRKHP